MRRVSVKPTAMMPPKSTSRHNYMVAAYIRCDPLSTRLVNMFLLFLFKSEGERCVARA